MALPCSWSPSALFRGYSFPNIEPRPKELLNQAGHSPWLLKKQRERNKGEQDNQAEIRTQRDAKWDARELVVQGQKVSADNYFDYIIKPASANAGTDLVVFENCEETGKPIAVLIECRYSYSGSEGSLSQSDVDDKVKLLEEVGSIFAR